MKAKPPTEGVLAALYLPVDQEGSLIESALESHLAWLGDKGVHGVLALGSSGEFPLMTLDERKRTLDTVLRYAGSLPVIANVSDINPRNAEELARYAHSIGLPGIAVMPPSFYKVSPDEQLSFFERIASAADLPVLLYNFPEMTGNRIAAETIVKFANAAPLFGIKQSGAEFAYHKELVAIGEEFGFSVLTGADTRLPEAFGIGAKGCIGGMVNFVPEYMVAIYDICRKGGTGDVAVFADRLRAVGTQLDAIDFPLNVGVGVQARGFEAGCSRLNVSTELRRSFDRTSAEMRALFDSWKLECASNASKA